MTTAPSPRHVFESLLAYCSANDWAGHDPYDALNSTLLTRYQSLNTRLPRLVLTQVLKRSPLDVRGLLGVPKTQNPKALGLFLAALLRARSFTDSVTSETLQRLKDALIQLRSPGTPYWCWGYSFPWQTRTEIVPRGAPNLVCTTFVGQSLLDVYEHLHDTRCLTMAVSAGQYLTKELFRSDESSAGFAYPLPSMPADIHNANLLAAAFLARVARLAGTRDLLAPALAAARYSAGRQRADGSWPYGELARQQWIDNFHTGYNLCALQALGRELESSEFEAHIERGLDFYRRHFFLENGTARYFHDKTYPIDIHCVAQSILTLVTFADRMPENMGLARKVLHWAIEHMWDSRGFFYYRVLRFGTIRTSYMRWSQAWMLHALASLLDVDTQTAATSMRSVVSVSSR